MSHFNKPIAPANDEPTSSLREMLAEMDVVAQDAAEVRKNLYAGTRRIAVFRCEVGDLVDMEDVAETMMCVLSGCTILESRKE